MVTKFFFRVLTIPSLLLAVACSSAPPLMSGPDRELSSLQPLNWNCRVAAPLAGHWEIRINDVDSKFVFRQGLYPTAAPDEVGIGDQVGKFVQKRFYFTSSELDLTVFTDQTSDACAGSGERCYEASLEKLKIDALDPVTAKELKRARWACAPQVD